MERKVALVTGGGTGIGRAIAVALAARGARVVVTGRRAGPLSETVSEIVAGGGEADHVVGDVSVEDDVARMVAVAVSAYGSLDLACNNAGIGDSGPHIKDTATEDFDRVIAVNLRGTFLCLKHELEVMNDGGSIVNVSSLNSIKSEPGAAAYCASKAGMDSLTKTAALEAAPAGIRVNSVLPGWVITPMHERSMEAAGGETPELVKEMEDLVPLSRRAEPREIAETVVWLLSDAASYVTGALLSVDGGLAAL